MSGVNNPNSDCLPAKVTPVRKSARIQSKRSLEVGLPTTTGFIGVLGLKNNQPFVSHINEPNVSYSRSYHTSQIAPITSPNLDLITTTISSISVTSHDSTRVQTVVGDSRLNLTQKDNVLTTSLGNKGPLFSQCENTMSHFTYTNIDNTPTYTVHSDAKIGNNDSYSQRSMGGQLQHDIKGDSMHIISGSHSKVESHHLDTVGCLPYRVSQVRDSNVVPTETLAPTTDQELQLVESEILFQARRVKELKLQQKKKTLLSLNKEAHQIELDMQSSCKGINGHARGEHYYVDSLMRTQPRPELDSNKNVGLRMPEKSNRISELKSIIKIEVEGNPRDEIRYFEDMCQSFKVFDLESRYQVLTSVWRPHTDIRNYFTAIGYDRRDYQSLVDYLSNRDGNLGRVFQPKPKFSSLNGQTLELEVKKWKGEMKDSETLKIFLYDHLAPDHIKGKIRDFRYLDIDRFKQRCRAICNADQQRINRAAKNISMFSIRMFL